MRHTLSNKSLGLLQIMLFKVTCKVIQLGLLWIPSFFQQTNTHWNVWIQLQIMLTSITQCSLIDQLSGSIIILAHAKTRLKPPNAWDVTLTVRFHCWEDDFKQHHIPHVLAFAVLNAWYLPTFINPDKTDFSADLSF